MDRLWSPWRYRYISTSTQEDPCIFCSHAKSDRDDENYIVFRAQRNYVMLNLYPYTNGHVLIAPYEHVSTLQAAAQETLIEMMQLTQTVEKHLRTLYRPHGVNLGMNIGEAAGAGIAGHIHMHVLPRWFGDANFLSVVGETRVLPEELSVTMEKLRSAFEAG